MLKNYEVNVQGAPGQCRAILGIIVLTMQQIQTLKGFRDYLGADAKKRAWVITQMRVVFERFGFEPLETPALEYEQLLLGKYGTEAEKLVYRFEDNGGRRVALRYDQTVPMARVISSYQNELVMPYKRYQIQPVWRADKPQKGRYREFYQCDADIIGTSSPVADAEILSLYYALYQQLGVTSLVLKVNDRSRLVETIQAQGVLDDRVMSVIQTIDKLDKLSESEVVAELVAKGLLEQNAQALLQALYATEPSDNLQAIIDTAVTLGVPRDALQFTPTLARGLDYYTGLIFEGIIPQYPVGSVGGGGRYDRLLNELSGLDAPAVGFGIGFERTVEALDELGLFPPFDAAARVVVCYFEETQQDAQVVVKNLRSAGISTSLYLGSSLKLEKQLKYADKMGAKYAVIVGETEMQSQSVIVKDLTQKTQKNVAISELARELCS